ncbi:hypothetical protein [Dyella sp. SG609]|uniref:hypothetical protein n=1 Tax=Dyella sp. SG609 TaxID=2587018 RepID=UPI0014469634|nr:hypothetical protein [Dyella sp. SG609]NKJ21973.1 hypothetical protein [Dyella sp. SG609]
MTSYTDEQVRNALEYHAITGARCAPELVESLLADRTRLQAEVEMLINSADRLLEASHHCTENQWCGEDEPWENMRQAIDSTRAKKGDV